MHQFQVEETVGRITSYRHQQNGLQVLLMPDNAAPVVTCMITYRVGSRHEGTGLTGATHFLEHLMFKGTERYHKRHGTSIFNTLQRVGAQVNATTWLDRTNYYALLPASSLPLALDIEADRMRGALLDAADVEQERTVILNEFDRGENEPIRVLYHQVWSTAYAAYPYHHPTIGWREDIEQLTPDGLRSFYDQYYWPSNATLSLIGDVSEATLEEVERAFGTIERGPTVYPEPHVREPEQRGMRTVTLNMPGELGAVVIAYKSPRGLDADTDALDVFAQILSEGKSSRLYPVLTDRGLTTHLGAGPSRLHQPGLFTFIAFLAPGATHEAVEDAFHAEVARVVESGVTEEECARAVDQLRAQFMFQQDGSYAIASELNEAIAMGDWRAYPTYVDRLAEVTPADIQRVAQTYLVSHRATVGRYIPEVYPTAPAEIEPTEEVSL